MAPVTLINVVDDADVRTVTMTHQPRRNALGTALLGELLPAIEDADCRALILRAEPGVTTWSAGHDVDDLPIDGTDPLAWTSPVEHLVRAVRGAAFPVIAAVEGGAWGAACNLAFACDLIVATRTAAFAITPAKLGVPYHSEGVAQFLAAVPAPVARAMFFTAEPLPADSPHLAGTVHLLVDTSDELTSQSQRLARRIASLAPLSIHAVKAEINALTDARPLTVEVFEHLASLRRQAWTSEDYREGLSAFRGRRAPDFRGQ